LEHIVPPQIEATLVRIRKGGECGSMPEYNIITTGKFTMIPDLENSSSRIGPVSEDAAIHSAAPVRFSSTDRPGRKSGVRDLDGSRRSKLGETKIERLFGQSIIMPLYIELTTNRSTNMSLRNESSQPPHTLLTLYTHITIKRQNGSHIEHRNN
jgi:hypothetical protein